MLILIGYFWLQNLKIEGQKLIKQKLEICKLKIKSLIAKSIYCLKL